MMSGCDENQKSAFVDLAHQGNLAQFVLSVILVDAPRVNPAVAEGHAFWR